MVGAAFIKEATKAEWDRLNKTVYDGELGPCPSVMATSGRKRIGSCKCVVHRRATDESDERTVERITISKRITKADVAIDTIRHEIAHAAAFLLNGTVDHGPDWKRHAKKCGADPVPNCNDHTAVDKGKPRYVIRCRSCHTTFKRYRKSKLVKNPGRYRCGNCKGTLERIK